MKILTELKKGETGRIKTIQGDGRFISRITSIGLSVGSDVKVMKNGFGMPMLLFAHDTLIAVSMKEAAKIRVKHGGV